MAAAAFDILADSYDALWTHSAAGHYQRQAVWQWVDPLIGRGDSILDLGCGTGEDALHLAARDAEVYAIDASEEMVRIARSKGVNAHTLSLEQLGSLARKFDGAISNFGVLNCVIGIEDVARALGRLIRPGGYLAICVMGPCCAWETFHFLRRAHIRKSFRRCASSVPSSIGVRVNYPSMERLTRAFQKDFGLIRWCGIGVCVPPSYITGLRHATVARLAQVDRQMAHWPLLRALSDHRLLLFRHV